MRIAMWSGPRNLSTAMMYSFGARADCAVWDEPFYAPFLVASGRDDPMRADILAAEETDPQKVAERCLGPIPDGKAFFYQKHMPHHMVKGIPRDWIAGVTNVFLIRHPARVIVSYAKKRENPTLDDIGFESQAQLFDEISAAQGKPPVVIDSTDIRQNPADMLEKLCVAIGMPYNEGMLSWPAGGHAQDGTWAAHWYPEVWKSTGFAPPEGVLPDVPDHLRPLLDAALPHYERLAKLAIR
ncbi:hypothetical protein [Rhizobium sp. L1K21]|uniref:sulfotransferase-like domain-containing protein n=1 Tax=Rhizobium sp. L1K21 TaxID=2954933 RepID=UPI002093AF89|nr:hypothetical protein [Rhizobium sp. L1K21]MCO6186814.1 hypothetical protein [Rhizobium sp. L1K21]